MDGGIMDRRRRYFIDKRFQRNFIIKFCLLIILGALISGTIIFKMTEGSSTQFFKDAHVKVENTNQYVLPSIVFSSVIVVVFIGIITIAVTLFATHKISGPLYAMRRDMQDLVDGNLTVKFHVRQADEVRALAECLDIMTAHLREDIAKIKNELKEIDAHPEKIKEGADRIKGIVSKYKT